jgi:hypothetical protein
MVLYVGCYGIGKVLLKHLVNSVSYALLKKLICSRINYLDMGEAMTSKDIRVSRIALKCEIGLS